MFVLCLKKSEIAGQVPNDRGMKKRAKRHSALDAESQKTKVVWKNEEVRKKSEIAGQGEQ